MNILITGSREITNSMRKKAIQVVEWCWENDHHIIVGDAPGIDHVVRFEALKLKVYITVYGAYDKIREPEMDKDWSKCVMTPGNYPERDFLMAKQCDMCVAIMKAPRTNGTFYTGKCVERLGKRVIWRIIP